MKYDTWKLDNNEKSTTCDCCECKIDSNDGILAKGYKNNDLELICEKCSEDLFICDRCNYACTENECSYGQDLCDDCCDLIAERYSDND
jgi:hypothetical protein